MKSHPNEWVRDLHSALAELAAIYNDEEDTQSKRSQAGLMLGRVIESLLQLQTFKSAEVLLPLKDLLIFLSDLERGRDHEWSSPVNFGGTSVNTTAESELQAWVHAAHVFLIGSGFQPVASYRRIADGLNRSRRVTRHNKAFTWQLIQRWCLDDRIKADVASATIARWWPQTTLFAEFHEAEGRGAAASDILKNHAGIFIDELWQSSFLRDRS